MCESCLPMGIALDVAGPIRRLLRRGDQHVCGLCRESHRDIVLAWQCLHRCWQAILARPPVLMRSKRGQGPYRCRFCGRDYRAIKAAETCAAACRGAIGPIVTPTEIAPALSLQAANQRKSKQIVHKLPGGRRLFRRHFDDLTKASEVHDELHDRTKPSDDRSSKSTNSKLDKQKLEDQSESSNTQQMIQSEVDASMKPDSFYDTPPSAPVSETSPSDIGDLSPTSDLKESASQNESGNAAHAGDGAQSDEPATADEPRKKPKPEKKFTRDGAKYVCTVCQEQYFTRVEVGKCYDGHD